MMVKPMTPADTLVILGAATLIPAAALAWAAAVPRPARVLVSRRR